jgi:hypothetical protein
MKLEPNKHNNRNGTLFTLKTKAICLDDEMEKDKSMLSKQNYYLNLFHYIHNNALEAKLVNIPKNWK